MDQKHGTKGDGRPKSDIQDPEQPPNPLQFLKWKEGATPKKRQAFTLSLKQLEEQKQRRQAFLALYPHRHIPTRAEIKLVSGRKVKYHISAPGIRAHRSSLTQSLGTIDKLIAKFLTLVLSLRSILDLRRDQFSGNGIPG